MKILKHQACLFFLILILFICILPHGASERAAAGQPVCPNGASFVSARNFSVDHNARDIVTGDFNNDGRLDLAVSNSHPAYAGQISIFAGNGRGEFVNVHGVLLPSLASRLARGDFNNDGKLDLAAAVLGDDTQGGISVGAGAWRLDVCYNPGLFHFGRSWGRAGCR